MTKIKIINDPVYGFIDVPYGLVLDVLNHRWFQRLRRIKQGGFSNLVYPGATHTRFHHALGAYHLGSKTVAVLRKKNVQISDKEEEALQLALLLHDIGHGPFSHSLEGLLVPLEHEQITLMYLNALNREFNGQLELAIDMFKGTYRRSFFHQLITSELDLDRMDYLARDSFFSGVSEGVIGYDRIIHMLHVVEDQLVVEEKGLNSIEKFLLARKLMYAQVYHHKMVVASEEMLSLLFERVREAIVDREELPDLPLIRFMRSDFDRDSEQMLEAFSLLDDSDVIVFLKSQLGNADLIRSIVSKGLIHRRVFRLFSGTREEVEEYFKAHECEFEQIPERLIRYGQVSSKTYSFERDEIQILMKSGILRTYGSIEGGANTGKRTVYYICHPHFKKDEN